MRKLLFLSVVASLLASCASSVKKPVETSVESEKKIEKQEISAGEIEKTEEPVVVKPEKKVPESELIISKFKHSDHVKVIKEYGCIPCHHFNVEMHIPDQGHAEEISEKFLKPTEASCKVCHTKGVE